MEAMVFILFQRVGGWCEPIWQKTFPLPESAERSAGSQPLSCVREVIAIWQFGWQRGIFTFRPRYRGTCMGREVFCNSGKENRRTHLTTADPSKMRKIEERGERQHD